MNEFEEEAEVPPQQDRKIPKFLYLTYIITILWGLWAFYAYWNGDQGWPNRTQWRKLQEAAKTTFPFKKEKPTVSQK